MKFKFKNVKLCNFEKLSANYADPLSPIPLQLRKFIRFIIYCLENYNF